VGGMGAWSLPDAGQVAWRRRLLNIAILSAGWCLAVSAMFINVCAGYPGGLCATSSCTHAWVWMHLMPCCRCLQITTTSLAAAKMASVGVATYPLAAFVICSAATACKSPGASRTQSWSL
jgi:hypothetical protein